MPVKKYFLHPSRFSHSQVQQQEHHGSKGRKVKLLLYDCGRLASSHNTQLASTHMKHQALPLCKGYPCCGSRADIQGRIPSDTIKPIALAFIFTDTQEENNKVHSSNRNFHTKIVPMLVLRQAPGRASPAVKPSWHCHSTFLMASVIIFYCSVMRVS